MGNKVSEIKSAEFGRGRSLRRKLGGEEALHGKQVKEDRVDFFLSKEEQPGTPARHSMSWSGTVDVRVTDTSKAKRRKGDWQLGLGVTVPAQDPDWVLGIGRKGEELLYPEEKQGLQLE